MKRLLTHTVICLYLGALLTGFLSHTLKFGHVAHPAMYFVVWDMFCGWAAYATRTEVIAEGESGNYYEIAPAPWGEFKPFGPLGRRQYDGFNLYVPGMIRNTLRQTTHEPISRVYVFDRVWPKKFNLPDHLWNHMFDEPRDVHEYYHLRAICDADGRLIEAYADWIRTQNLLSVADNPRLRKHARSGQPFFNMIGRPRTVTDSEPGPLVGPPLGD